MPNRLDLGTFPGCVVGYDFPATFDPEQFSAAAAYGLGSGLGIAQGTTIVSAHLAWRPIVIINDCTTPPTAGRTVQSDFSGDPYTCSYVGRTIRFRVNAHDADTVTPTLDPNVLDAAPRHGPTPQEIVTTATNAAGAGASFISEVDVYLIDVTSLLQHLVNRAGWTASSAARFFLDEDGSDNDGGVFPLFTNVFGPQITAPNNRPALEVSV